MADRHFDASDYPYGCRCACCEAEFEDGEEVYDREVAEEWTTPTCVACHAASTSLAAGHPFAAGVPVVARPDGSIARLRAS